MIPHTFLLTGCTYVYIGLYLWDQCLQTMASANVKFQTMHKHLDEKEQKAHTEQKNTYTHTTAQEKQKCNAGHLH